MYATPTLTLTLTKILKDLLGLFICLTILRLMDKIRSYNILNLKDDIMSSGYHLIRNLSIVKNILQKEQTKLEAEFDKDLKSRSRILGTLNTKLPKKGLKHEEILALMNDCTKGENVKWEEGRISGAVYHGRHEHIELLNKAFGLYSISNPLHPDIWPSVMKFESEIIRMTASMVDGGLDSVCGCTTSGGTESIILAIKAHRDYYRERFNIQAPEMIVASSAHAAVDKACDLMGIKLVKLPCDPKTYRVDVGSFWRNITPNTIMMYSSAPSYPYGSIDPVRDLSALAVQFGIGLHVDLCLGGFILPFAKKLGYNIPDFDFSLPGVTSMSLDTHKYGYALKGSSVVLYRNKEYRHAQYFCYADWTGGMYTTPTIAGSRSGGLIAQCWASMMALGEDSYMEHTKDIMEVARTIADAVRKIDGLVLTGEVDAMIVCFDGAPGVNIYKVGDCMSKRGWSLNALQKPACLHICCTVTHVGKTDEFIKDLKDSVQEVLSNPGMKGGNAAIYGMTSALPSGPVNELLKVYNDVVLKV